MSGSYDNFFKQAERAKTKDRFSLGTSDRDQKSNTQKSNTQKSNTQKSNHHKPSHQQSNKKSGGGNASPSVSTELSPEAHLRLELARRMRLKHEQNRVARAKKQKVPAFALFVVSSILVFGSIAYFYPESIDFIAAHVDLSMFGEASASPAASKESAKESAKDAAKDSTKEAKSAESGHSKAEEVAAAKGEEKKNETPDIRHWSNEELSFFNKLNDRKKELDLREDELAKLEAELQQQRLAIDEKLKQLDAMRAQISQTLKGRVASDQQKVDKLVEFYSTMKPQQAAKIIETLNEDLSIEVLDKMKKKNAAEILNALDSKKARHLSELLAGYQRSPATAEQENKEQSSGGAKEQGNSKEQGNKAQ
jgi:flagellar motility protein MotE (MotC chaperone)